jgi:NUMOD4 motif
MEKWEFAVQSQKMLYFVSDEGRVKSINKKSKKEMLLKFGDNGEGYCYIKVIIRKIIE